MNTKIKLQGSVDQNIIDRPNLMEMPPVALPYSKQKAHRTNRYPQFSAFVGIFRRQAQEF